MTTTEKITVGIMAAATLLLLKRNVLSTDGVGRPGHRRGRLRVRMNRRRPGVGLTVTREISLTQFEPWSGAVPHYRMLTYSELENLTSMFEDLYPEGVDETTINDIFWFEPDTIAEWLGYENWEDLENHREQ